MFLIDVSKEGALKTFHEIHHDMSTLLKLATLPLDYRRINHQRTKETQKQFHRISVMLIPRYFSFIHRYSPHQHIRKINLNHVECFHNKDC